MAVKITDDTQIAILTAAVEACQAVKQQNGENTHVRVEFVTLYLDLHGKQLGWNVKVGGGLTVMWLDAPYPLHMEPWVHFHGQHRAVAVNRVAHSGVRRFISYRRNYKGDWFESNSGSVSVPRS